MIPEYFPVFTADDILLSENEYEKGDKKTSVGWLKDLFLFSHPTAHHLWITVEDRKDYNSAIDKFRKLSTIKGNLHEWEDSTTAKKQAAALNLLRKKMGYTEIVDA